MKKIIISLAFLISLSSMAHNLDYDELPKCYMNKVGDILVSTTIDGTIHYGGIEELIQLVAEEECQMPRKSVCYVDEKFQFGDEHCPAHIEYKVRVNGMNVKRILDRHRCDYNSAGVKIYGIERAGKKAKKFKNMLTQAGICPRNFE